MEKQILEIALTHGGEPLDSNISTPKTNTKAPNQEVKETGLGLSFTKDENFREWYSEVAVDGEMIAYNDISSYYIPR
ncbi:hypothetical protein SCA6_007706 [Theobroma cacao]